MTGGDRYWQARKITLIGALKNLVLGLLKMIGGFLWHSHALVADGVHSLADLFTDFLVLSASRFGSRSPDPSHPYGHQRIETAATFLLALILVLTGLGIGFDAVIEFLDEKPDTPDMLALPVILLSLLANEALYHYTRHVAKKIGSNLLAANAWHHRSDAASSAVVLVGLLGVFAGFTSLDTIAAFIVGGMIIKMGLSLGWGSIRELVDTAVSADMREQIEETIARVDGVERIHQMRTRMMAGEILVDVHVLVGPRISVSEGHFIAQHVHRALLHAIPAIRDVTVHIDPEDDEEVCPSLHLPNRRALEDAFLRDMQKQFPDIQSVTLHYLDGKMEMDIVRAAHSDSQEALLAWLAGRIPSAVEEVRILKALAKS